MHALALVLAAAVSIALQAGPIGNAAPSFALRSTSGALVGLESLRGRVVVLNFWATWCLPCQEEMPALQRIHAELRDRDVVVLGISSEPPALVRRFASRRGISFQTLTDVGGAVARTYGVEGLPVGVVIDRSGTVRSYFVGARDEAIWRLAVANALTEP